MDPFEAEDYPGGDEERTIHPAWHDSPEMRRARRMAGPDASPAEVIEALIEVIDAVELARDRLEDWAASKGVSIGDVVDTIAEARLLAGKPDVRPSEEHPGEGRTPDAVRRSVRRLWLLGVAPAGIAELLDLNEADVARIVGSRGYSPQAAEVVTLNGQGRSPAQIARTLGISRGFVYKVLEELGLQSNPERKQLPETKKRDVVAHYKRLVHAGATGVWRTLQDEHGLTRKQVEKTLAWGRRQGLLTDEDRVRPAP